MMPQLSDKVAFTLHLLSLIVFKHRNTSQLKFLFIAYSYISAASMIHAQTEAKFYIKQYVIEGSKRLKNVETEEAVYPFMGPSRTPEDVEQARLALEKVYRDKGFETVSVSVPQQDPRFGVIRMQVTEGRIGRLRVNGSTFFSPNKIKKDIPSLTEGSVPDMNQVKKEIIGLNRLADRRVVPSLNPGSEPGTFDVDLTVEDDIPLHGNFELNNRYNANTSPLRINGSLNYGNLFQLGHTAGLSFQVAPENPDDALVFSGYYLMRTSENTSLLFQAVKQNSDISTLGGAAVTGAGETLGVRILYDLPRTDHFYQNLSIGIDYKNSEEDIVIGTNTISAPIEYYPLSANYSSGWIRDKSFTDFNLSINLNLRGLGSDERDFANKRFGASGNYIYLRSDVSHTQDFADGSKVFAKIQGQVSSGPLINAEQFSAGGIGTVRGYLEATSQGDNAIFGTVEYRTPSLIGKADEKGKLSNEWRFHTFIDGGVLRYYEPLPSQSSHFSLLSGGIGTRFKVNDYYNGSLDVAVPFIDQANANAGDVHVTFRSWVEF